MKANRIYAALAIVAVLAVAGCGSSSKSSSTSSSAPATTSTPAPTSTPSSGGGGSGNLKISADPSGAFKFNTSSLSAKAGNVTITMSNPSSVQHGIAIDGNGVSKTGSIVNQGATSTVSAKLKPGKYTFFCPVPGHRQAGMQGTLTVK
jgi:plastocyanin